MGLPLLGSLSVWLPAQVPQDPNANALFRRQGTQHQPLRKTWLFSTTRRPAPWIFPRNHGPQGGRWCCPCLVCKNGGGPNVTKSDSSTKHTIYYTVYIYIIHILCIYQLLVEDAAGSHLHLSMPSQWHRKSPGELLPSLGRHELQLDGTSTFDIIW